MTDPLSVAGFAVALPGLFITCIQCFDLVQSGRSHSERYELPVTRLAIQKYQLFVCGQDVGLVETSEISGNCRSLDDEPLRSLVERILLNICRIFQDTDALVNRYGLTAAAQPSNTLLALPPTQSLPLKASYQEFMSRLKRKQSNTKIAKLIKWAIHDEANFKAMSADIENLVASLRSVTSPGPLSRAVGDMSLDEREDLCRVESAPEQHSQSKIGPR